MHSDGVHSPAILVSTDLVESDLLSLRGPNNYLPYYYVFKNNKSLNLIFVVVYIELFYCNFICEKS